jgi:hypothetical protein
MDIDPARSRIRQSITGAMIMKSINANESSESDISLDCAEKNDRNLRRRFSAKNPASSREFIRHEVSINHFFREARRAKLIFDEKLLRLARSRAEARV